MDESRRHIVLVGLPGSGKTTVGRLVAQSLGARFVDVDVLMEEGQGATVAEIFARDGEAVFRALERRAVEETLDSVSPCVVAPGGGWAAQPGALAAVGSSALTVYLEVPAAVAAERLSSGARRPLVQGDDPAARVGELLARRREFYEASHAMVCGDQAAESVAAEVVELARRKGGW